ncbi:T9SS type B sorting domain-containing protein [Aureibacter tunicatorum]|uniref:Gliding motility-associated C-terminal domain-containing protein n=1 Tax=Aureibacter tunicatorum TaxID=866807 RepID=A0AAE3XTP1_9BACT|nr:gliding motility-associated C-terminal domain-containing protein [Aureibacter tunicatorum]MDR6241681.1 hypothetical protein [Aureibacter tunicatorum]BDD07333.1 hypothetical protein AUTU_48160 [Aureibacter tunicatorum]
MKVNKYIIPVLLSFSCLSFSANAQNVINNGKLLIDKDTELTIEGQGLIIESGASVSNAGQVNLDGDWVNRSNFENYSGDGKVVLNGGNAQRLEGEQQIHELTFESSEKTISGKTIVGHKFEYDQIVQIEDADKDIFALGKDAEPIEGNENLYINGPLYHQGIGEGKLYAIGSDLLGYNPIKTSISESSDDLLLGFEIMANDNFETVDSVRAVAADFVWKKRIAEGQLLTGKVLLEDIGENDINYQPNLESDITKEDLTIVESLEASPFYDLGADFEGGDWLISQTNLSTELISYVTYGIGGQTIELVIPNALTPQVALNDLSAVENSVFKLYGGTNVSDENFTLHIVDRSGRVVFNTSSLALMREEGWNGKVDNTGNYVETGVYDYLIRGRYKNGAKLERKGVVHMIR